jgi:hypothetical protein
MINVEILKGYNDVQNRSIKTKDGSPRVLYSQKAFLDLGGAFPIEFTLSVESPALAYPVGNYQLNLSCIKVNKFGSLEIDPYNVSLDRKMIQHDLKAVSEHK